jgi:heat shock protein 90kDa beta
MVKRVFITSDLGEDALPKWASWVKVVVDGAPLTSSPFTLAITESNPLSSQRTTSR